MEKYRDHLNADQKDTHAQYHDELIRDVIDGRAAILTNNLLAVHYMDHYPEYRDHFHFSDLKHKMMHLYFMVRRSFFLSEQIDFK